MINKDGLNFCDCCREQKPGVDFVKFPAVDAHMQYQEFCEPCRKQFYAWKRGEITIRELFKAHNKDNL